MQLGTFQKDAKTGEFTGSLRTLTSSVNNIRIVPRPPKTADTNKDAPDYDVLGPTGSDFGAGWTQKRQADGIEYISLRLYDPSFNNGQALRPALWPRREGGYVLIHEPLEPQVTTTAPDPVPPPRAADQNGGAPRRPAASRDTQQPK